MITSDKWPREEGKIAFAIMGSAGDTKQIWDRNNEDEVANAKRTWKDLVEKKKYLAFKVGKDGEKDEQVRSFDPNVERLIFVPPMQGG